MTAAKNRNLGFYCDQIYVFLIITFAVYDRVEIMVSKHHLLCNNVMITVSKHRVNLTKYLLKLHGVQIISSK